MFRVVLSALMLACCLLSPMGLNAQLPSSNPIVLENALTGNLPSEWDITGSGDPSIQGFATDISVNRGQTINFKINTTAASYRVDIYRLGYYGGLGARKVASVTPTASLPQTQPVGVYDTATGLFDCGNWAVSATWSVPTNATSGVYIARPVRSDTGGASHIVFIVRDDAGQSDLLFQTSDTTWQAYNTYGGASLYQGDGPGTGGGVDGRSYKVSYNRPFNDGTASGGGEYPMIRWLEANGYHVSYASGVDTDRRGSAALTLHKVFLSVGHDEYWSGGQRANVEAARAAGVHLAFFSGNEIFWKTRWENSIDGTGTPYRTLVCYKETAANAKIDPTPVWTGTWRDPRFSPPADGGRPENALSGQIFTVNAFRNDPIVISSSEGKLRFWRNTGLAALADGQTTQLPAGVLGYEWDEALDNGFQPPGLIRLSTTTLPVQSYIQDYGSTYGLGIATHSLTLYRHSSGALVFGAGTVQWSWGLDANHDISRPAPDVRMQQATVNLFADMGVQPITLQPGLVPAALSTDIIAPTSVIQTPPGFTVPAWTPLPIYGTATDSGGGRPAAVELSVDGGTTWHPATGAANWSARLAPGAPGSITIKSRAIDDSGRIENPGPTVTITVTGNSFRGTLWPPEATPTVLDSTETLPIELGVRFQSDQDGWITALRFYKSAANTGVHVGNLWANNGTLLATVAFTDETASGWQQAVLPTPVPISAGTPYVASYHTENGHWSVDDYCFAGKSVDRGPLHAPADGVAGPNGIALYGPSAFPIHTFRSRNYWVDVVYAFSLNPDTTPPIVTARSPADGASNVGPLEAVAAEFNEDMLESTISSSNFSLRNAQNDNVPASVTYDAINRVARLQPSVALTVGVTYTATVKGGSLGVSDLAGNRLSSDFVWSFTTALPPSGPTTLWPPNTIPTIIDALNAQALEFGVRFKSDFDGWITALRFYKSAANTGVHVGNLWATNGTLLATVTFTNETTSGWQQAQFPTPIPVTAATPYIASYHTENGHYSVDVLYFAGIGVDRGPLHAPADSAAEPNGLYVYGPSAFPTNTYQSGNYWVDVVFTAPNQAAMPTFSPVGGTYSTTQSVTLSDTSPGAQIRYTTNGSTPTASSTLYTAPIPITTTRTIKAIAIVTGWTNSTVASATYTLQAAVPTFNPVGGTYYSATQSVTLSDTSPGAQIRYTTNGSTPTASSTLYTAPIPITTTRTIKAIAIVTGWTNSTVASATYTFQAAVPAFSPVGGIYSTAQSVTLSDTSPGAQIRYTTNGSTPTTSSTLYTAPIAVTTTTTINAIAVVAGWSNSTVASATYTLQAAPPTFNPIGGTYSSAQSVTLSNTSPGAQMYYTTNGSTPTTSSTLYTAPIAVTTTTTINAIAVVAGWSNSTIASATYTLQPPPPPTEPSALSAIAASPNQINLSWNDNATNEAGFKIERKMGTDGTYAQIATVAANATNYSDASVSGSTTYVYRVRATNAGGDSAYSNEATVTTPVRSMPLLWLDSDIGSTGVAGSASYSSGSFTVNGSGADIWDIVDAFHFLYQTLTGDGEIIARVMSVQNTDPWAKAGVMIRESLTPNSEHAMMVVTPGNGLAFQRRLSTGGASTHTAGAAVTAPYWVRLVRLGNTFTGYASSNGVSWTQVGSDTITMAATVQIGLAVTAHNNALLNTSVLDNVSVTAQPVTPTGLTASAASSSQINLSWVDASNETGYKIERKTGAGGIYAQIATVGAGVTAYTNTGLAALTTYFYRVRSTNSLGDSAYSAEASAITSNTVPAAPAGLTASAVSSNQINLSWTDVSNETGFKVERKTGAGGTYAQIATVGAGVTAYTNTGLAAATTYFYRVRATNAVGDSVYSPEASATTFDTVPAAPSGLNVTAVSSNQINLSWVDNASNETGFKVERKTGAGGTYAQIATVGAGVTAYTNTGLAAATTYFYRVRATNSVGDSAYSTEASATTSNTVPAAPAGLTASAVSSNQINLSWVDVSNETGFKIERKTGAGGTYGQIATVGASVTTYTNTGLTTATTYFYRVRATNAVGDSAYSSEASATTFTALPAAPSSLTPIATFSTQINLTWVDNASNETGFKIERKTGAGGTYAQIVTVGPNVTVYTNTGLAAAATYFYRVRATNVIGDSAYSIEASATTLIPTFRAAASASAASGVLSLTINKPAGAQQGDVMVASIAFRPSTTTINASGWTLIRRLNNASGNANSLAVYYKVAGVSEPASYAWTFNTSTGSAGGIQSFSGIDTANPVDVEAGQNTASGLTHTAPSVTTRFASDMIVTSHSFSTAATFTSPAGMTEAFDVSNTAVPNAVGETIQGNYALQTAVGATGPRTATASNDADVGNAHTLALKAK